MIQTCYLFLNECGCACVSGRKKEKKGTIILSSFNLAHCLGSMAHFQTTAGQQLAGSSSLYNLILLLFWCEVWLAGKVAHILLKHSLALDHTWIPWKANRKKVRLIGTQQQLMSGTDELKPTKYLGQQEQTNWTPYLLTHADLHNGIADKCFTQIFVLLLLKQFDVCPGCFHKISEGTDKETCRHASVCVKQEELKCVLQTEWPQSRLYKLIQRKKRVRGTDVQ